MATLLPNEVVLPVINMSQFPLDFEGQQGIHQLESHPMVATLREACKEWGFFSIVNHGISESLQQNVESLIRELCAMPAEVKEKAVNSKQSESYARNACEENFTLLNVPHSNSVQEQGDRIWPLEANPKFCETIRAYTLVLADLASKIIKMIIASLGLDVKAFYHSDFEGFSSNMRINHSNMRINHYFPSGKAMDEEMLFPHTDIGFFTILYQDNEGGLQIRSKEGTWLNVKPLSNSFVISVADTLKVWSNGRYHSGEHRVVYKGWKDRISLPLCSCQRINKSGLLLSWWTTIIHDVIGLIPSPNSNEIISIISNLTTQSLQHSLYVCRSITIRNYSVEVMCTVHSSMILYSVWQCKNYTISA